MKKNHLIFLHIVLLNFMNKYRKMFVQNNQKITKISSF